MREIELEHLSGPLQGQKSNFGADRLRITLGRDEHCDLIYPETASQVAAEHLELVRDAGYYELRTNTRAAVSVNGAVGLDGQELEQGDVIELGGSGGPKFSIQYKGAAAERGDAHRSRDDAALLRGARRTQTLLLSVVVLLGGWLLWLILRGETTRDELGKSISLLTSEVRERKAPLFETAIASVEPSVYLVLSKSPKLGETALGTAWVVGDHLLATNAHVGLLFEEAKKQKKRMIVRASGAPHADVEIVSVKIHPAFEDFAKTWTDYAPRVFDDEGKDQPLLGMLGYDVALLEVAPGTALARPLPLASDAALRALKAGDPVAYVGFPMENLVQLDLSAPNPVSQVASLIGLATFTLIKPLDGSGQLLEHSLPGTGGASGSPIINPQGEVIGLFNAGNVISSPLIGRMPSAAQVNFGQRVDVLRQLLEPASLDMNALHAQWTHDLERYKNRRRATQIILENALDRWADQYGENTRPQTVRHETLAINGKSNIDGAPAERVVFDASPGHYFIAAVSPGYRNIDAVAARTPAPEDTAITILASDSAAEHYPMISFDIDQNESISYFVLDKDFEATAELPTSNAEVTIYQIPIPPPPRTQTLLDEWLDKFKRNGILHDVEVPGE
jgi:hypothetical protein